MKTEAKQENVDEIDSLKTWINQNEDLLAEGVTVQTRNIPVKMMPSVNTESTVTFQTFDQYCNNFRKHDQRKFSGDTGAQLEYDLFGLAGECGEIHSEMKKLLREDITPEEFREKLLLECGDVLHYLSKILGDIESSLEECALINIEKLNNRIIYGKGKHGIRS